uniref:Sulfotransferase domain-containing protein n=1 Tax=Strigamia maritima TaxID=126957 RepID=T1J647_STRMM
SSKISWYHSLYQSALQSVQTKYRYAIYLQGHQKMIRMKKLIFAFSYIMILSLVIYALEKFAGISSMDSKVIHLIEKKIAKPTKKAVISSMPSFIAAPSVDIHKIQKTSIINGQSKVRNNSAVKSPVAALPVNTDIWPVIANPEKEAVSTARLRTRIELFGVNSLTGFVSESSDLNSLPPLNTKKMQIIILTSWRSGSTFVSEIINHHPGTFYHYEPLHLAVGHTLINKTMEDKAVKLLSDLFNCSYTSENDYYLKGAKQKINHHCFQQNTRLWNSCHRRPKLCFDAKFVSEMCNEFPFQVMKRSQRYYEFSHET